jgi:hypothetical protein
VTAQEDFMPRSSNFMTFSVSIFIASCLLQLPQQAQANADAAQVSDAAKSSANRATVSAVAAQIRTQYFAKDKAEQVAGMLEQQAATGAFDGYSHGGDLATALTRQLQPLDKHFAVQFRQALTQPARSMNGPGISMAQELQRQNYGFKQLEILPGNIGYLRLDQFAEPAAEALQAADSALGFLANTSAIIIDLRQNGGGAPGMVGYLVSAFTAKDAAIYNEFQQRQGTFSEAPARFYAKPRLDVPLFLLISGRSASAAEGFSYTLQAAKRTTVLGEASAGAANPGGFFPAGEQFQVFVSTGSPVNPITQSNWEGSGVQPDIQVTAEQALEKAQLQALQQLLANAPEHGLKQSWIWAAELLQSPATPDEATLAAYSGVYQDLTIRQSGQGLTLQRGRRPLQYLQPLAEGQFAFKGNADVRLRFVREYNQQIRALEIYTLAGTVQRFARSDTAGARPAAQPDQRSGQGR